MNWQQIAQQTFSAKPMHAVYTNAMFLCIGPVTFTDTSIYVQHIGLHVSQGNRGELDGQRCLGGCPRCLSGNPLENLHALCDIRTQSAVLL